MTESLHNRLCRLEADRRRNFRQRTRTMILRVTPDFYAALEALARQHQVQPATIAIAGAELILDQNVAAGAEREREQKRGTWGPAQSPETHGPDGPVWKNPHQEDR